MVRTALIVSGLIALCLLPGITSAAVAKADSGTPFVATASSVTTIDLTTLTVSAGSNRCLVAYVAIGRDDSSGPTMNWDSAGTPQAMTLKTGDQNPGQGTMYIFKLIAPTTGNKVLTASWTGAGSATLGAISFSGADQSTCTDGAHDEFSNSTSNPQSLAVTSTTDGATFAPIYAKGSTIASTDTQTEIWRENTNGTAASYALGGTSNTHTFTKGGAVPGEILSVHILAAAGTSVQTSGRITTLGVGR